MESRVRSQRRVFGANVRNYLNSIYVCLLNICYIVFVRRRVDQMLCEEEVIPLVERTVKALKPSGFGGRLAICWRSRNAFQCRCCIDRKTTTDSELRVSQQTIVFDLIRYLKITHNGANTAVQEQSVSTLVSYFLGLLLALRYFAY